MHARRGYTLIELLLVVAILAIAALLLVPSLVRRDTYAVEAALRRLVADITFAQSDALAGQGYRRVFFDPEGRGWSVARVRESALGLPFDQETADYVRDPLASGDGQPMVVELDRDPRFAGVRVESIQLDGSRNWITFDPLGGTIAEAGVPGTGGSLVVRSDNLTYRVEIGAFTGKVSIARAEDPLGP
jgi:prepilin-type N-terminal cleavage/methylation domain-containing protein